ncbi:MAG: hypothetical protein A2X35_11720 [Elusimicrobia bacterium GWA2_61_42]|nr:MAG: hypothetical protein A2X35_11720 [Elusimicrobia bacterium GWA2_61_42]OGR75798.1 MAG: hypothetical protein A2X38_07200 [Elusimicrobia bacterium GWC2_61_25]
MVRVQENHMPTKPKLGEFVEKDGKLYFIKAENLPVTPCKESAHPVVGYAYLLGYGIAVALMMLAMFIVVLFPFPMFALLVSAVVLKTS